MNLEALAQLGQLTPQQVVRSLNYVFGKTSDAQARALIAAAKNNGRVYRGGQPGQAGVTTLKALAKAGYLKLTAHPGTCKSNWSHGDLTITGYREVLRILGT